VNPHLRRHARWPAGLIVALVVALDQATKWIVRGRFNLYDSLDVIPGFFSLTRVHNYGAAFGMLSSAELPYQAAVLTAVRIAALGGLAWFATTVPASHWLARVGLSLVLGGAAGNLVDGLTLGYVVDFFDFYWRGWHFWAFNIADSAITVGMALIILDQIGVGRHRVPKAV
jgi:signal peptidase II